MADDIYSDDWIAPEGDPPGWETEPSHNWAEHIAAGRKLKYANEASLTQEQRDKIRERQETLKKKAEGPKDEN